MRQIYIYIVHSWKSGNNSLAISIYLDFLQLKKAVEKYTIGVDILCTYHMYVVCK